MVAASWSGMTKWFEATYGTPSTPGLGAARTTTEEARRATCAHGLCRRGGERQVEVEAEEEEEEDGEGQT